MFSRKKIAMLVAEILGTAILTSVVLAVSNSPIGLAYFVALAVGITMTLLVLIFGPTSGAHVNPAVTLSFWTVRKINTIQALVYIAAQFMGAALAWRLYTYFIDAPVKNIAGNNFDWRVVVAEVVGTMIFTFGIAAAVYQKYEGGKLAATVGGSLMLGLLVASVASNGILNPAIALGVQSWSKAYVFGPLVGGVVGMNLYALLFADKEVVAAVAKPTPAKAAAKNATTKRSAQRTTKKTTTKKATKTTRKRK